MLRPTVTNVETTAEYQLLLVFDNGEKKSFDVKPYIKGNWYSELNDEAYFKSVRANGYTVEWPHGQDLCPDELYYNSKEMNKVV